jgi:hypothetical protein
METRWPAFYLVLFYFFDKEEEEKKKKTGKEARLVWGRGKYYSP